MPITKIQQIRQSGAAVDTEKLRQQTDRIRHEAQTGVSDDVVVKRSKRTFRIMASLLAASFILVGILIYWTVFPYQVLDIKSPAPIQPTHVKPGELVFIIANYCKKTDAQGDITRFLVSDSIEYRLPAQTDTQKAQCMKDIPVPVLIPQEVRPDRYHIRYRVLYKVNPIKEIEEVFATQSFTVEPK